MHFPRCLLAVAVTLGSLTNCKSFIIFGLFLRLVFGDAAAIEVTQNTQIVEVPGCPDPSFILSFSKSIQVSPSESVYY